MEQQQQNPPANANGSAAATEVDEETPDLATFNRFKNDMNRWKDEARKKDEELKALKDKDMRDKEQWKEFGAAKEKEAGEWKTKYETLSSSLVDSAKIQKVREECVKLGLVETAADDLELMEFKDVVVETTSRGKVNVIGAKAAAERIKSIRPHWFQAAKPPTVNGKAPEVNNANATAVSYEDLSKLEEQARKTGDYAEYNKKIMEFKRSRR